MPEQIQNMFSKKSAWELTVTPGWRALWSKHVSVQAVGDNEEKYGMNSARAGQVKQLLVLAGVTDPYGSVAPDSIPKHLSAKAKSVVGAIDELVELRGQIVHTGKVPDTLRKKHVLAWRSFVESAANGIDDACRDQSKTLLQ